MNKQDYSSNFKMKVSRSLTDLQNSLDEACRLGLPPHFQADMTNHYDEFNKNNNPKNDITHNLERIIANKERSFQHTQFVPPTNSSFQLQNDDGDSNYSVRVANHRERYLNVLRHLADDNRLDKMQRSQSHDSLIHSRQCHNDSVNQIVVGDDLTHEVRVLRQRLVQMDEEMIRLRAKESPREDFSLRELCDELKKKLETSRVREEALLGQLTDAIATIEEAKFEEMQATMHAEKAKEDLENMDKRFKEYVEENIARMCNQTEGVEKEVQTSIRHVMTELEGARCEISAKFAECQSVRDQLRSAVCEVDRLRMSVKAVEEERMNTVHSLEGCVARAMAQRDETVAHNGRLQTALDKEAADRARERSILEEEMIELRKRLRRAEDNEVTESQQRMAVMKECAEVKNEVATIRQAVLLERRCEEEERARRESGWEERLRLLTDHIDKKERHYEAMLAEAEEVMQGQGAMIARLRGELAVTVKEVETWAERGREEREELRWRLARSLEEAHEGDGRARQLQGVVEDQARVVEAVRAKCGELESVKASQDREILALMEARNTMMRTTETMQAHLTEFRRRVGDCQCGVFDCGEQLVNARLLEHVVSTL